MLMPWLSYATGGKPRGQKVLLSCKWQRGHVWAHATHCWSDGKRGHVALSLRIVPVLLDSDFIHEPTQTWNKLEEKVDGGNRESIPLMPQWRHLARTPLAEAAEHFTHTHTPAGISAIHCRCFVDLCELQMRGRREVKYCAHNSAGWF